MARIKYGKTTRSRRKRWIKRAKGYYGLKKSSYKKAHEQVVRSMAYAFVGRKEKKRDFRQLWITRINAAVRPYGLSYSHFMHGLKTANVDINRKMLSELAITSPKEFEKVVNMVQTTLNHPVTHLEIHVKPHQEVVVEEKPVSTKTVVKKIVEVKEEEKKAKAPVKKRLSMKEREAIDGSETITETREELEAAANHLRSKLDESEKTLLKIKLSNLTKQELIKYMGKIKRKLNAVKK